MEGVLCLWISLFMTELKHTLFQAEFYAFVNNTRLGKGKNQSAGHKVPLCLRFQPQQRGLQISVLILISPLLWPPPRGKEMPEAFSQQTLNLNQGLDAEGLLLCTNERMRRQERERNDVINEKAASVGSGALST